MLRHGTKNLSDAVLLMDERKQAMIKMHESGMTYAEIGAFMGISKQRVYQLIGDTRKGCHKPITKEQCVYAGIRKYMNENKISKMMLVRMIYKRVDGEEYKRVHDALKGCNCRKNMIDKILKATGLTYEYAFKKDGDNDA